MSDQANGNGSGPSSKRSAGEPPQPRLSATILLLRDQPGLEVLMVKRHYEIDFASGALVFPGGKAVAADGAPEWASRIDGDFEGDALAARVSAVREAFEEAGVLLARKATSRGADAPLVGQDVTEALSPMRGPIDRGDADFLELMREHDLVLALDRLVHFGHWITPTMMPKRFDTHFYLAATPPNQIAEQDGRETTEAVWLTPQAALDAEAAGTSTIIFPTRMNLKRLAMAADTSGALARFSSLPVPTVLPEVSTDAEGKPCLRIPEVEGYGQTIEPLENVKNVAKPR
ncbi:MAG: NUDIX hydrolase [Pseudomonadota bacterium]